MITIFRKIRRKLAEDNKPKKYLRYAIGEILLVVIGILIALQINQWNKDRLDKVEAKEILLNLHEEFQQSKIQLAKSIQGSRKAIAAGSGLLQLIGLDRSELSYKHIDSLIYYSLSDKEFIQSDNAIANIVQSGKLNLIKDKKISNLLYQWSSIIKNIRDREESLDKWTSEIVLPYLIKYISFKEVDKNSGYNWSGSSKLNRDYYPLFQQLEYENILDNSLYFMQKTLEQLLEADLILDKLIEATKP